MDYVIREAVSEDTKEISKLMSQLTGKVIAPLHIENRLHFIRSSPFDSLFVCVEDGCIQGTLGFRIRENLEEVTRYGEVSVIVVDEEAKRKGIGRILMEYAEQLAVEHECVGLWLVSGFQREDEAHNFYKQLGFEETGYRFVKRFL
ncbi:GNAT family N-acetyltransferase [Paenibacillus hexagrammi]|uniref:GNAT family N-acetyltransferase n=1 Tax=Paenibacillus hexagrammi TaxID=2908839 RepID=A0ABY3SHG7_9BACL|nr:GNAT family N-acetyltransferase [Paenibacillus sp. YPD9-1]UJF33488.1 GNAT family N-acetyltransferase [Paenibacillus sp. YPD9-1]